MRITWKYTVSLLSLLPLVGCDVNRAGSESIAGPSARAAVVPTVLGTYRGSARAHVRTSFGWTRDVSCPIRIDIVKQADEHFSGALTLQSGGDCKIESGTLDGTVGADGAITVVADAPGGGANVFEDAAVRAGCTLVRSSGAFSGTIAAGVFAARGDAVYDCGNGFGRFRVNVDVSVAATNLSFASGSRTPPS